MDARKTEGRERSRAWLLVSLAACALATGGCGVRQQKVKDWQGLVAVMQSEPGLVAVPGEETVEYVEKEGVKGREKGIGMYVFSIPEGWEFVRAAGGDREDPGYLAVLFKRGETKLNLIAREPEDSVLHSNGTVEYVKKLGADWGAIRKRYKTDEELMTAVLKMRPQDVDAKRAVYGHRKEELDKLMMLEVKRVTIRGDAGAVRFRTKHYHGVMSVNEEGRTSSVQADVFTEEGKCDGELLMSAWPPGAESKEAMEMVLATFRRYKAPDSKEGK